MKSSLLLFSFLLICSGAWSLHSARSGRDPEVYLVRASTFMQNGNWDGALVQAEIARELKPDRTEPYLLLAQIHELQSNRDKALDILLECVQKCKSIPDPVLDKLFQVSTQDRILVVSPHGHNTMLGARGIADSKIREKIVSAFKRRPELFLLFVERFIIQGNITDTFNLLAGFKCPAHSRWLYQSIRARGFYLFGRKSDLEETVREILKETSTDYVRLYELAKVCLNASLDDAAERFLLAAKKSVDSRDKGYEEKISLALKSPRVLLDDENSD